MLTGRSWQVPKKKQSPNIPELSNMYCPKALDSFKMNQALIFVFDDLQGYFSEDEVLHPDVTQLQNCREPTTKQRLFEG